MESKKLNATQIDGVIDFEENRQSSDTFFDLFIDWIEVNGWTFAGVMSPVDTSKENQDR